MANIKSAKKRARQSEKRRLVNLSRKTEIKTTIKQFMAAVQKGEPKEKVMELFNATQAMMMRAKSKGLIHRNAASRKISRLAKKIAK